MIKKIIHIAPFEKFIKAAHNTFEAAFPNANIFYIIKREADYPYSLGFDNYKILDENEENFNVVLADIETADYVFLHYLEDTKARIISKISNKSCKIVWIPWGADLYENKLFYQEPLYGKKTKRLIFKELLLSYIRIIAKTILLKNRKNAIKDSLKLIDIIACAVPQEFNLLKKTGLFRYNLDMINFSYYPLEIVVSDDMDIKKETHIKADTILIGNSAIATNNHLEAFDILRKLVVSDKKIVVPLNYGDKKYANEVVKYGKKTFGQNFNPILNFMPLDNYNQLISSCGFAIMNQYRQQAIGNIITLLWGGTKVFLNDNNLVYPFLKEIGCIIFSINNDLFKEPFSLLSKSEIEHNRMILKERFCSFTVVDTLQKQLNKASHTEGVHIEI